MTQTVERSWREVAAGGLVSAPGSTERNLTGSWRARRPIIDFDRCTHCMICWVLCPDSCFETEQGRLLSVDLDYCKGCGICAKECPRTCIEMVPEKQEG